MSVNLEAAEQGIFGRRLPHRRRVALRAVLEAWPSFDRDSWTNREQARKTIYSQAYGSVILVLCIVTVAEAALTWVVERVLDRLFPRKDSAAMAEDFWGQMNEWSRGTA